MGDAISSFLFQPPPPSKLKESKIIWLNTSRGTRIPAFYIEAARNAKTGTIDAHSRSPNDLHSSNGGSGVGGNGVGGSGSPSSSAGIRKRHVLGENPAAAGTGEDDNRRGVTLLYSHANAEDLGNIYPWCKFLSKSLGVNVLAYDYTGYGLATDQGDPSEEHCYADIDAAYSYLRDTLQVPARNVVLYGRSLGSGPSCYLASRTADDGLPLGGLILHAPFQSVYRVVLESGCTLPGDKFPNIDFLPFVRSPVMLIHGTKDQIVPFHHSEQLLAVVEPPYRATPLLIEGMGHNNIHPMVRPLFVERIAEFMKEHVKKSAAAAAAGGNHRRSANNNESLEKLMTRGYVSSPGRRSAYGSKKLDQ